MDKKQLNKGGLNLWPLVIIGALIYVFMHYDVETIAKNKQLNKNIEYVKSFILSNFDQLKSNVKNNFLKGDFSSLNTSKASNTTDQNKDTGTQGNQLINLSLENFLPEGIPIKEGLNKINTKNNYDKLLETNNNNTEGGLK